MNMLAASIILLNIAVALRFSAS